MSTRSIIEAFQKLAGNQLEDKVGIAVCTVDSVDLDKMTCEVTQISGRGEVSIPNVLLQADVADGVLNVPVIGSTVVVVYSRFVPPFVALYSDVESMLYVAGNASVELEDGKIFLNGQQYGGLVRVVDLVSKLNNLEQKVNQIIAAYNLHTHPVSGGATGVPVAPITGTLQPTIREDIENENVLHGIEL